MTHQVVGYIRISSNSQNTARQLQGIKLDKEFVDIMSGNTTDRKGLADCIEYVRQGDQLVVDSIDRLARNLRDLQELVEKIISKGVSVKFIKENLTFNSNKDPMANLTLQMMGAFAEFERSMIKARQREGIDAARAAGRPTGRPSKITPELIDKARKYIEKGESIRRTAHLLKVSRATIYNVLGLNAKKNPRWEFS
jgi:DNA invertase Pin-like site-specific DNA recombinase